MLARAHAYTVVGLEAVPITVEVDAGRGLPQLTIVGLPDQAVKEARERVRSAILNSQFELPQQRLTVNLAPAGLKKEGGAFDLAIALGILAASRQLEPATLERVALLGELALDGSLRPSRGVLPVALQLRHRPEVTLIVPHANVAEARVVQDVPVIGLTNLRDVVSYLAGESVPLAVRPSGETTERPSSASAAPDFAEVKGQAFAKRALEIAVAGGHHVLMIGPPGSGKSMLAQRIPGIQPALSLDEALECTTIHSVLGLLPPGQALLRQRPFRAPHHTTSAAALIGGGTVPKPGEASVAHHGVLFLDELPEFRRDVLESLRQPLEDGTVSIARMRGAARFPARFMLVAAMNPCPCGYLTDRRHACRCNPAKVEAYLAKVSGPLLDRIDLHIDVPAVAAAQLLDPLPEGESSAVIQARVAAARTRQQARLSEDGLLINARMRSRHLARHVKPTRDAVALLRRAIEELGLSARAHDKILKIARTIADLAGTEAVTSEHLAEAIQYRSLDRRLRV